MKKLVITTQYMENYGSKENPYMKFKGGSTYVMYNCGDLDSNEQATLVARVRPFVTTTLTDSNGGCEEYVMSDAIIDHSEKAWDNWETPIQFSIAMNGNVNFLKVTDNREDGYMRKSILEKTESWTGCMESNTGRKDYSVEFLMENGDFCNGNKEVRAWLDANDPEKEIELPEVKF